MSTGLAETVQRWLEPGGDVTTSDVTVVWTLAGSDPSLAAAFFEGREAVRTVSESLSQALPHPRTHGSMRCGAFVRPAGHGRSFYISVETGSGGGHVAVKGSEVVTDDYVAWMRQLREQRQYWGFNGGDGFTTFRTPLDTMLNNLERWPIVERKVPGAVTLVEAMDEVSIAVAFQRDYRRRYGEFARVPVPLLVLGWPQSVTERVLADLRPLLSRRGMQIVEAEVSSGLAAFVYFYPSLPIRLMSFGGAKGRRAAAARITDIERVHSTPSAGFGWSYEDRAEQIARLIEPRTVIERWTELVARMLALGYLPKDPGCLMTADCLQPWNAVLDGGFVDVDSIASISDLDAATIDDGIRRTMRGLAINVGCLMLGHVALSIEFRERYPELTATVWADIRRRLEREAAAGGIPPALEPLVKSLDVYGDLDRLFRRVTAASHISG